MMDLPSPFPDGRRAAVSLTYDDALAEHLDNAIPDLEAANLRGTFFIPTGQGMNGSTWHTRGAEWKSAAARGHEIGNHTQNHPCSLSHSWVKPNRSLEAYDLSRMEMELIAASHDIKAILGEDHQHSFAYPCGEDFVGPDHVSYRPIVKRLFPAARAARAKTPADPMDLAIDFVPGWAVLSSTPVDRIIDFIDSAIEYSGWAVLIFHGVGGGHSIDISRTTHRAVCKHIVSRSDELYCDTFRNVARRLIVA